jgi:AraC-like DNA-binding protein
VIVPYREQTAPAALVRWMECSWCVAAENSATIYPVPPDGCVDLVYSQPEGLRVIGAMTVEQRFDLPPDGITIGVRLRTGMARALLRLPLSEITDGALSLAELWGARARVLEERIGEARSLGEGARVLAGGLAVPAEAPNGVQRAIEAIAAAQGNVDLDEVARQANLSPRQFRRRCLEESGLTPKFLCRVLRFRHARSLAAGALRPQWSGIAADAGYFDQAHLIRDFREFTGRTPMSVSSNTRNMRAR